MSNDRLNVHETYSITPRFGHCRSFINILLEVREALANYRPTSSVRLKKRWSCSILRRGDPGGFWTQLDSRSRLYSVGSYVSKCGSVGIVC